MTKKNSLIKKSIAFVLSVMFTLTSFTITGFVPTMDALADTAVCNTENLTGRWMVDANYQKDASGHSRDMDTYSGISWNTDKDYPSAKFSSARSKYQTSSNLLSNGIAGGCEGSDIGTTIAFMAYANSITSSPYFCIYNSNHSTNGYKTLFSLAPNGATVYNNSSGSAHNKSSSDTNAQIETGAWHTFVIKFFTSKYMEIWVDGKIKFREQSDYYDNHTFDIPNTIKIGANRETNAYFDGYIRDFRIYNKDLSATTVHQNLLDIAKESSTGKLSGTLTNNGTGLAKGGSSSRWADSQFNIVNDQQADNTSAGIIRYDIKSIKGKSVETASLNYQVDSWGADSQITGLTFYYSTSISDSTYINNNQTQVSGCSFGSGTTANNSFASKLGFSTSNIFVNVSKGNATSMTTVDIKNALQKALDENKDYLYIYIMQTTAGGAGSNNGWSDTKVSPSKITIDYSVKNKDRTRTDVANVKSNITETKLNKAPYSGTMENTHDGSYSNSSLTGNDEMLNVLYSYGVGGNSAFTTKSNNQWWEGYYQYGSATLLYDGVNDMAFPINFAVKRTTATFNDGYNQKPHSVHVVPQYTELRHIWHGYKNGAGYASSTTYGVNTADGHIVSNPKSHDLTSGNQTDYYSNTLYFKHDYNYSFSNNLCVIEKITYNAYVADNNKSDTDGYWAQTSVGGNVNNGEQIIRIINYKPIYDAITIGKGIYNIVSKDEYSYCPNDLYNFYNALDKLMSFNPNDYFAYNNNGYEACCNAMAELDDYINPAKTTPKKSTVTYTHSYTDGQTSGNWKHNGVCQDCGEILPAEDCIWNDGVITKQPTCKETGIKTYTCQKCNGTKIEILNKTDTHTPNGNWKPSIGDISHENQHWCSCSVCGTIIYENCSLENVLGTYIEPTCSEEGKNFDKECKICDRYVDGSPIEKLPHTEVVITGTPATCETSGLTDGKKCSVCGTITVQQEVIPAQGHDWTGAIEDIPGNNDQHLRHCARDNTHTRLENHNYPAEGAQDGLRYIFDCSDCNYKWIRFGHVDSFNYCYEDSSKLFIKYQITLGADKLYDSLQDLVNDNPLPSIQAKHGSISSEGIITYGSHFVNGSVPVEKTGVNISVQTVSCENTTELKERVYPTCQQDGYEIYYCTVCKDEFSRTLKKLNHEFVSYTYDNNATCTENGTKTAQCENIDQNTGLRCTEVSTVNDPDHPALGHSFTNYVSDDNATCLRNGTKTAQCDNGCGETDEIEIHDSKLPHSYTGKSHHVLPEESMWQDNSYTEYLCVNGCNEYGDRKYDYVDWSAYDSSLKHADIVKNDSEFNDKYTSSSINEFNKYYSLGTQFTQGDVTKSSRCVNYMATMLVEAENKLVLNSVNVTFQYQKNSSSAPILVFNKFFDYGSAVDMKIPQSDISVEKWVMSTDIEEKMYAKTQTEIAYVAKKPAVLTAFINEKQSPVDSHVVTVMNKLNRVAGYLYVPDGHAITLSGGTVSYDGSTVKSESTPFYDIVGYSINGTIYSNTTYTVNSDLTLITAYDSMNKLVITLDGASNISFSRPITSGNTYNAIWDEKIVASTNDGTEKTWYVQVGAKKTPVAYGSTYTFRASNTMTIYADDETATNGTAITCAQYLSDTRQARVICSSYKDSAKVIEEQGIFVATSTSKDHIFTNDDMVYATKIKTSKTTDTKDQFSYTLTISQTSKVRAFGVRSYVKYVDDSEYYVSDTVTINSNIID